MQYIIENYILHLHKTYYSNATIVSNVAFFVMKQV